MTAQASVRSVEDIVAAIRGFADSHWIRLQKASRYFAWVYGLDAEDLLQEAYCRALEGTRQCPANVDVVRFLVLAMRSIASGESAKVENQVEVLVVSQPGAPVDGAVDPPDSAPGPEDILITADDSDAMRRELLELFPNDAQARDLTDGILAGYEREELQELIGLDLKSYASKRRFMRRTIDKKYANGRKS